MKNTILLILILCFVLSCNNSASDITLTNPSVQKNDTVFYSIDILENFENISKEKLDTITINWDHTKDYHFLRFGKFNQYSKVSIYDKHGPQVQCFGDGSISSSLFNVNEEARLNITDLDRQKFLRIPDQIYEIRFFIFSKEFPNDLNVQHDYHFKLKINN